MLNGKEINALYKEALVNEDKIALLKALRVVNKTSWHILNSKINFFARDSNSELLSLLLQDKRVNLKRKIPDAFALACQTGNQEVISFLCNNYFEFFTYKQKRSFSDGWLIAEERGFYNTSTYLLKFDFFKDILKNYKTNNQEIKNKILEMYNKRLNQLKIMEF